MVDLEQEYLSAVARIKAGNVTHPKLVAAAKDGKLKLNITNVALEAGRARTTIATEDTPYPSVRVAVYGPRLAKGQLKTLPIASQSVQAHLVASRVEKRDAEYVLRIVATKLVAAEKKVHELQKKLDGANAKIERLQNLID
jgi:hypothetical protein